MEIAIIHERFQLHFEGTASPHEGVVNVGSIFALAHPDTLFQKRIGQRVGPHRRRAFQVKILKQQKALRIDGAAGPAMGREREIRPVVVHDFVDGRDKLRAAQGRLQSSDEQSVVTTSLASGNGARRISADPVGHQPLARFGSGKLATNFAAKLNFRLFRHAPLPGHR